MSWLRRWRERDDRDLIKSAAPLPEIDPIEELDRIISAAKNATHRTNGALNA